MHYRIGCLILTLFLAACTPEFTPEQIAFESDPRILRGEWSGESILDYPVAPLVYSPDGSRLFYKKAFNNAIYDTETLSEVVTLELDDATEFAQFSSDGATLAAATVADYEEMNTVSLYNARTGERLDTFSVQGDVLGFSSDLERFAMKLLPRQIDTEEVVVRDVSSRERLTFFTLPTISDGFYAIVEISADLETVITCEEKFDNETSIIKLWSIENGQERFSAPERDTLSCPDLVLSQDGTLLAVGNGAGTRIWDVATGELLSELNDATQPLALDRDNQRLVSGDGSSIGIWDVQTGTKLKEVFVGETWYGYFQALDPQLSQFAWADAEGQLQLLDLDSGSVLANVALNESPDIQLDLTATYVDTTSYAVSGTLLYDSETYSVRGGVRGGGAQEYVKPMTTPPTTYVDLEALDADGEVRWVLEGSGPTYDYRNGEVQLDKVLLEGRISRSEKMWPRTYIMERQP